MYVAVGSGNPVKRDATARVFPGATVVAEAVPSGVSEQPIGHDETRAGAQNRAEAVLETVRDEADDSEETRLGVGIEGGVASFGDGRVVDDANAAADAEAPATDTYLVMWAAATDGDRWGVGSGPSLRLPESIATRIHDGEELGPVMDDVLGESNVAKNQGAAGAFTAGQLTRTDALEDAVAAAAAPFLSGLY
ncbi:inosine/xanthosine triphosphatase [Halobellus sp. H-GB7]|uniref:inosine/xanthosine triphosphatase n=1 Tax=Halobellus sp. H-GB7 TaxID=3069756 RepID=UPI0027B3E61F|nr:inosine/xanthosine triphosphatase [Halobellus sp. H-GB7]MDQ2053400.1 inosine/xanthosine triphosphatase [Halobellus sp. H-GB7]